MTFNGEVVVVDDVQKPSIQVRCTRYVSLDLELEIVELSGR